MSGSRKRILVIEDNPMNMELFTDLLEASGFVVQQARTAEDGLCQARALPDLILMDVSLPGMDGLEATRVLRADPVTCGLPVVALTAHAMKGDAEFALQAGCNGYLTKPIDTRSFVQCLAGFMKRAAGTQSP
jgi:CheY-like chemotaxis protein